MKLKVVGMRGAKLATAGLALLLIVSCGGGTQVEKYVPTRVLAFGDENSVIESDGRKYTVNGLSSDGLGTIDCQASALWIQQLAFYYGLVFQQCPGTVVSPTSRIYAAYGAKVADVAAQVAAAGGAFGPKDLATVLVGANDVIALYGQFNGSNTDALKASAEAVGAALAGQIVAISKAGAKVLYSTVPDVGQTPFALKEDLSFGTGRAALLSQLTERLNAKLRTGVSAKLGGHEASQMLADESFHAIVATATTAPNALTYLNVTVPVCDPTLVTPPAVLGCTTATLITGTTTPALAAGGTASNYLWADDRHLSRGGQATLGALAVTQINRTPL